MCAVQFLTILISVCYVFYLEFVNWKGRQFIMTLSVTRIVLINYKNGFTIRMFYVPIVRFPVHFLFRNLLHLANVHLFLGHNV